MVGTLTLQIKKEYEKKATKNKHKKEAQYRKRYAKLRTMFYLN